VEDAAIRSIFGRRNSLFLLGFLFSL
jgi:hypothetical protein